MEKYIQLAIIIHAALGGIALLAGLIAIISKKGQLIHKKSGIVFYYAMIASGTSAIVIALMPKHESPFLIAIGVFSLYFVIGGYRALRFKSMTTSIKNDKIISIIMLITGALMILLPLVISQSINLVLLIFGIIGILFALRDLKLYQNREQLKKGWLKLHLGKMLGGYISTTTAFVVVNGFFPGIYNWFIPSVIGTIYITYWMRKIDKNTASKNLRS